MNSIKSALLTVWAWLQYRLGAFIFHSGLGRWHKRMHEFAMSCVHRAANKGLADAELLIGQLLRYRGASVYHKQAAVKYLRKAANTGSADAQFMLAEALSDESLQLTAVDEGEIRTLYKSAADQGHIMAALRLKKAFTLGLWGLAMDSNKADYWSHKFMASSKPESQD